MKNGNNKYKNKSGGIYAGVNISKKSADILAALSAGALALCLFAVIFYC